MQPGAVLLPQPGHVPMSFRQQAWHSDVIIRKDLGQPIRTQRRDRH